MSKPRTFEMDFTNDEDFENYYEFTASITADASYDRGGHSDPSGWDVNIRKIDVFYVEGFNTDADEPFQYNIEKMPKLKKMLEDWARDWLDSNFDEWYDYLE